MELPDPGRTLRLTCVASARQTALGILVAMLLVALNVAWVARALGPPPHRPREVLELDHRRYIAMAGAFPGASADPPGPRGPVLLAHPFTAARLRRDVRRASSCTSPTGRSTLLFLTLFLFALFRYLLGLGFDMAGALVGMTLASLMPGAVRWYAYQYWMPDPLCLFLVVLGPAPRGAPPPHGLVVRRPCRAADARELAAGDRLCAGALDPCSPAGARRFVAGSPSSGCRYSPSPRCGSGSCRTGGPTLLGAAREMLAFRARHLFENQLYFATLGSFGVLVPLLAARAGRVPGFCAGLPRAWRSSRWRMARWPSRTTRTGCWSTRSRS